MLWMPEIRDITSGFRVLRTTALKSIDLSKLEKRGYTYKIQLLYLIHRQGGRIAEVPIHFGLRDRGDSKMGMENLTGSLKLVVQLRIKESASFIKFLISGFAGLIVQTSIFYGLTFEFNIDPKKEKGLFLRGKLLFIAAWPIFLLAFIGVVRNKRLTYVVTPKGNTQTRLHTPELFTPHLILGSITFFGIIIGYYTNHFANQMIFWAILNTAFMFWFFFSEFIAGGIATYKLNHP
jgi:hypothetical protein